MDDSWGDRAKPAIVLTEQRVTTASGLSVLVLGLLGLIASVALFIGGAAGALPVLILLGIAGFFTSIYFLAGLFIVNPNEAKVLQLFGSYKGTVHDAGLRYANPFYSKKRVSVRVRNFESEKLKVNDHNGNPIEIAAVVVWKVIDTAEALFHVDNFEHFVRVQSEAALRNLATSYPYDAHVEGEIALRSHTAEVAEHLRSEIQARLTQAGVEVIEARISHLAYAPEIAGVMLQRQQASAVVAARQKIVEGAVGMVEMALEMLTQRNIVHLSEERRAEMVCNLLVVLCGERAAQPMINTSSVRHVNSVV